MVINIAYFARDHETREQLTIAAAIRATTLKLCYMIPGYQQRTTQEKNTTYDNIRALIDALYKY